MGAAAGFIVSVGFEFFKNYTSSGDITAKEAFQKINWKNVAVASVAGAVAGATFGALGATSLLPGVLPVINTTSIGGAAIAGGLASVAGGQAAALTSATIDTSANLINNKFITKNPDYSVLRDAPEGFLHGAIDEGFMNPKRMAWDFGTGALLAGAVQAVGNMTNSTGSSVYATRQSRAANAAIPGFLGSFVRGVSEIGREAASQWLSKKLDRLEK